MPDNASPPHELLKDWIVLASIPFAEAARQVNYDRSNFHRLLEGRIRPSIDLAHEIQTLTNGAVPIEAWIGFEPKKPEKIAA